MSLRALGSWRQALPRSRTEPGLRSWLLERGSLTARLRACCREFRVDCLAQGLAPAGVEEAACLGLRPGTLVRVRDVLLCTDGMPAVFAHTVMPRAPRHDLDRRFERLGSRSLGSLLFADPGIARGHLEFLALDARHPLFQACLASTGVDARRLWARRSCFGKGGKGLLVNEVFLPGVLELRPNP